MITSEEFPEIGLEVLRGRIDPVLINDYALECETIFINNIEELSLTRGENSPGCVSALKKTSPADLWGVGYTAINRVLSGLEVINRGIFVINWQEPRSSQQFHSDIYKRLPVTTVHAHGGGAFDIAPASQTAEEAEKNFVTIELNAGDVVLQSRAHLKHRGRNRTDFPRITTVSY